MKKLVFGLVGFLMLITVIGTVIVIVFSPRSSCSQSCESNACADTETVSKDESQCVYTKTHYISGEHGQVNAVRHFEYGGHKYIQFKIWGHTEATAALSTTLTAPVTQTKTQSDKANGIYKRIDL